MTGEPFTSRGGHVLATNGHLHDAMLDVIAKFRARACSEADGVIPARDSRHANRHDFAAVFAECSGTRPAIIAPAKERSYASTDSSAGLVTLVGSWASSGPRRRQLSNRSSFSIGGFSPAVGGSHGRTTAMCW